MVELSNTNVFINGYEFHAVRMVSLELTIKPIKHPAEEIFTITDHIRHLPNKFKMTLRMFDRWEDTTLVERREDKLDLLKKWYKDRRLNSLYTDLGDYENMLIVNVKAVEDNSSKTSFDAEIQIEEVMIAFLQPITEQWYVDTDGKTYDQSPYESSNIDGVLTKPKPDAPEDEGWFPGKHLGEFADWLNDNMPTMPEQQYWWDIG